MTTKATFLRRLARPGVANRADPIFQPSIGEAHRLQSQANPARFTWLHTNRSTTGGKPAACSGVNVRWGVLDAYANSAITRDRSSR